MAKDRSFEDTISEKEYTMRMKSASTKPEDDSPGDSEMDAGAEFGMGLEYLPDKKNDPEVPTEESLSDLEVEKKHSIGKVEQPILKKIPDTAQVISSEQPAPWMDRDNDSSTN